MGDAPRRRFGCFFAVRPAQPTLDSTRLREACDSIDDVRLRWTHHRESELVHPQLPRPLPFIEISGILTLESSDDNPDDICESIAQRIDAHDDVGNVEVLLLLQETPIPVLDTKLPIGQDPAAAKELFDDYGLVSVQNVLHDTGAEELTEHTMQVFTKLYGALCARADGGTHFAEIMARDKNRFDFRIDIEEGPWKTLGQEKGDWLPYIEAILGQASELTRAGCVLSMPGTGLQYWHSDGVHSGETADCDSDVAAPCHALCVFLPLIDLTEHTGYTEFWAGSHKYGKLLSKKGEQALPGGTHGIMSKGDCLIYDYRTIHRGVANTSAGARPVVYFLYTRQGYNWVEDQNFTEKSVFE